MQLPFFSFFLLLAFLSGHFIYPQALMLLKSLHLGLTILTTSMILDTESAD